MALLLLNPYLDVILALGLAWLSLKIVQALFGPFSTIKVIGDAVRSLENTIATSLTRACDDILKPVDEAVGTSLHQIARLTDRVGRDIAGQASTLLALATPIGALLTLYHGIKSLVRHFSAVAHVATAGVKTLEKEYHGIEHRVKALEKDWAKGIGHDLRIGLKAAEREIAHVENVVVPDIRAIANTAESDVTELQKWITKNVPLIGTTALVGSVAWALSALGLGGLRCPSFGRLLNKWGCGLGSLLDGLLGLVISALALENVCDLLPVLEGAFGAVVGPLTNLLTGVPLGGCETPPQSWTALSVSVPQQPPPQALGSFPT